jgi:hypothetical protein
MVMIGKLSACSSEEVRSVQLAGACLGSAGKLEQSGYVGGFY